MTRSRYDRGDSPRGRAGSSGNGRGGNGRGTPAPEGRDPYENYERSSRGRRTMDRGGPDPYNAAGRPKGGASSPGGGSGGSPIQLNVGTIAVLAGVLVVGIGIGTALSTNTPGDQGNIASSQQLDLAVPDPEFCKQWGASAFVMDVELYTTMNPSSSFVTQPTLQPGCVIRRENWSVLQKEGAVTSEQMRQCKQRMNTFAYIGSIRDKPIVRCVYQTDISGNKFQTRGIAGAADDSVGITPEANQF
ncbi:DUF3172 domain-containing protein [Synechococcus sp. CS-205]|uniref:DUF3172 domain-containing protein n=1 Tax=Synechococcus sp. CS-205 TaxID=2847984 RepID=UPI00223B8FE2|nr:DUF3172 domain-containing protein [Synechococcus sp. CS-205]